MSKLAGVRYETAYYDDTQGNLSPGKDVPPTYPPTLDSYKTSYRVSGVQSFGSQTVSGTGPTLVSVPANATCHLFAAAANTQVIGITVNTVLQPGIAAQTATLYCTPGQVITLPFNLNPGAFTVQAYSAMGTGSAAAFSAQLVWNL